MQITLSIFTACLVILIFLTAGIAYRTFVGWKKPGARTFGFLMLAMTVWSAFYLLEIILPTISLKIASRKILYLGMGISPPLWLGFALRYTGINQWWSQRGRVFMLTVPGVIAFLFGLTNESHKLIWRSMEMPSGMTFAPLQITLGPGFWFFATIAYFFIGVGLLVYIIAYFRSPKVFRRQTGTMLLGALVTLTFNLLFISQVPSQNFDPTPLSFAVSVPLFAIGYFRFGLFNLFPIAAPIIMENLRDVIIVTDTENRITDLNSSAQQWLEVNEDMTGAFVFDVLPEAEMFKREWDNSSGAIKFKLSRNSHTVWYEASIIQLGKNKRDYIGRVLVIHDITQEHELLEAELRRSAQLGLLEEAGRLVADSFDENEILQHSLDTVINRFGYAEAAISKLTPDHYMEIAAIAGKQDFGYTPGYRQEVGKGIIGHTAEIRKTYISKNVSQDPYYYSNNTHSGSAVCVPIFNEKELYGALYVESIESKPMDEEDAKMLETLVNQISASLQRAELYSRAQDHLRIMSTVQAVSRVVISSLDLETIFKTVVLELQKAFGYTHVSIYRLQDDHLHLGAQVGYPEEMVIYKIHISQGVSGRTIKTKTAQFIQDAAREPDFLRADNNIRSEICIPLLKENNVLGTLNVEGGIDRMLTKDDVELLIALSAPIALAMDNARLHAQVKAMAMTDAVSGLSNRHALEEYLIAEVERSRRLNLFLSLIIFDIDSFKEYNDKWGHPAGDMRLKAVAELIRRNLRKYDIAARYGGDEFAIILPNTEENGAMELAKRLLQSARAEAVETFSEEKAVVPGYTLSIGVATFPKNGVSLAGLLLSADHAEIMAKRLGKNQIFVASNLNKNEQT